MDICILPGLYYQSTVYISWSVYNVSIFTISEALFNDTINIIHNILKNISRNERYE